MKSRYNKTTPSNSVPRWANIHLSVRQQPYLFQPPDCHTIRSHNKCCVAHEVIEMPRPVHQCGVIFPAGTLRPLAVVWLIWCICSDKCQMCSSEIVASHLFSVWMYPTARGHKSGYILALFSSTALLPIRERVSWGCTPIQLDFHSLHYYIIIPYI